MTKFCIDLEDMMLPDAIAAVVEAWLDAQSEENPSKSQIQEDGFECLRKLLNEEPRLDGVDTYREVFLLYCNGHEELSTGIHARSLGRHGIKLTDDGLVLSNSMEFIYGKTKWRNGGHRESLRILPGAQATNGAVHFADAGTSRGTIIPWNHVI